MTSTTARSTAPGIALQTLFRNVKPSVLRQLIAPSVLATIRRLDPDLDLDSRLAQLAISLIEPSEALRNPDMRARIIRMLPLPKARELGECLGIPDGRGLYDDLCAQLATGESQGALNSFLGVVSPPRPPDDTLPSATRISAGYPLFDHQRIAADRAAKALAETPRKVVLHMPTGSGKTRTAMHIVADHLCRHEPTVVCWLAHNAELLEQAAAELERAWHCLGNRPTSLIRFWGYRRPDVLDIHDGVIVAGLGKMSALDGRSPSTLLRLADRVSLTIIDEAHQAIAPTYSAILTALYSKRPRNALLGLTATPGRSWSDIAEDQKLSDYFEGRKVILDVEGYEDPVSFLIKNGYLARPVFRTLNSKSELTLSEAEVDRVSSAIDVPEQILGRLGSDTQRNATILLAVEELLERHRRVIVFAPSVDGAKLLAGVLSLRDHEAFVITAQSSSSERERVVRRFRSEGEEVMVVVNYGVLTTGFDAPATSAAVIARPTRSLVLYSQMVGRATRGPRAGGNEGAEIVTVVDPHLPGFGSVTDAFRNWEDVWNEPDHAR